VALTGDNLCPSGITAFILALKHSYSFVNTYFHRRVLLFLAKFGIAAINTGIGFLMVKNMSNVDTSEYYLIALPLTTIFVLSLLFANILFTAFETTQITLLQCLYADIDIANLKTKG